MLNNVKVNKVSKNIMEGYKVTVAGVPKSGKTSLFAELVQRTYGSLDKGLIVAFEKGYGAIEGVHAIDIPDWETFTDLVDDLTDEKYLKQEDRYRVLALDVMDIASRLLLQFVVKRASRIDGVKYNKLNDIPWGGGYELVENEVHTQFSKLEQAGYGLYFISHHKDRKVEEKDGTTYDKVEVSVAGRVGEYVKGASDFIIFIDMNKEKNKKTKEVEVTRTIRFRGDGTTEAGGRMSHIPDVIPYDIPLFIETMEEAIQHEIDNPLGSSGRKSLDESKKDSQKTKKKALDKVEKNEKSRVDEKEVDKDESVSVSIEDIKASITDAFKELDLSKEDKKEWGQKTKDILGIINYNKSDDIDGLNELLSLVEEAK